MGYRRRGKGTVQDELMRGRGNLLGRKKTLMLQFRDFCNRGCSRR